MYKINNLFQNNPFMQLYMIILTEFKVERCKIQIKNPKFKYRCHTKVCQKNITKTRIEQKIRDR